MRAVDLVLRFAFFATVPFFLTLVSALFPMTGVLVNVALALVVFAFAEAVRLRARRSRVLAFLVRRQLAFEAYYREHPPRAFLYYIFSPLLFPYWLVRREARRELGLYRDLTGFGLIILVGAATLDFFRNWQPDLSLARFLSLWAALFVVQTLCTLVLLMPIATTVVKLHLERRFAWLWLLLATAVISVGVAVNDLEHRRGHIVSWMTIERAALRTERLPAGARAAQLAALREVWAHPDELASSTDKRGWVEDDALDRAEEALERFYKTDEAYGFSLHALPPEAPQLLLLQLNLGRGRAPIWRAIRRSGEEVLSPSELPPGVLGAPRKSTRKPPTRRSSYRHAG